MEVSGTEPSSETDPECAVSWVLMKVPSVNGERKRFSAAGSRCRNNQMRMWRNSNFLLSQDIPQLAPGGPETTPKFGKKKTPSRKQWKNLVTPQ